MSLYAIWLLILEAKDKISLGFVILIILASVVQISKININPWDWFFGLIGKKINREVNDKIDQIQTKLDKHISDDDKEKLEVKRRDILEFANSCMVGHKHTQEQFTFVIKKCDEYESYIEENNVKNGEISLAIQEIRRLNARCRQHNSYLKPGEEIEK